jgi:hypothetical protein
MEICQETFLTEDWHLIFKFIDRLVNEEIYIGGDFETAIPISDYEILLESFPTKYELNIYSDMRITRILREYLGTMSDAEKKFNRHIQKKESRIKQHTTTHKYTRYEILKYRFIYDSIDGMLKRSESYSEKEWQRRILEFILLIMPKYIKALENVKVHDSYTNPDRPTDRFCDIMLIDANGYIDLIEIKKPFPNCLMSPKQYRDNHIPKRDLSGAAMQIEKYIFHLNKWGTEGEKKLNKKYRNELPDNVSIKITNPKGLLIIGKDDFNGEQKSDFEIVKRHYSNIVDIITYDDLLGRLKNCIAMLEKSVTCTEEK